jgi:transposase
MPHELPPWAAVYQQARRWLAWGCFAARLDALRAVLRETLGRSANPSAVLIDARPPRSSPESGEPAGYDGGKRKKGSKRRSIPWAICWPCASPQRMSTSGRKSGL